MRSEIPYRNQLTVLLWGDSIKIKITVKLVLFAHIIRILLRWMLCFSSLYLQFTLFILKIKRRKAVYFPAKAAALNDVERGQIYSAQSKFSGRVDESGTKTRDEINSRANVSACLDWSAGRAAWQIVWRAVTVACNALEGYWWAPMASGAWQSMRHARYVSSLSNFRIIIWPGSCAAKIDRRPQWLFGARRDNLCSSQVG